MSSHDLDEVVLVQEKSKQHHFPLYLVQSKCVILALIQVPYARCESVDGLSALKDQSDLLSGLPVHQDHAIPLADYSSLHRLSASEIDMHPWRLTAWLVSSDLNKDLFQNDSSSHSMQFPCKNHLHIFITTQVSSL